MSSSGLTHCMHYCPNKLTRISRKNRCSQLIA